MKASVPPMATPMKPAMRPMRSVSSVPVVITAKRLRPCRSLPKGRLHDGGCNIRADSGRALSGLTSQPPISAKAISPKSRRIPTSRDLLRRR